MSLLSYNDLVKLVENNVITNVKPENINASSIDLTLGNSILIEDRYKGKTVSLKLRDKLYMKELNLPYALSPGEFILAHTEQKFYLPDDISAEYKLKSSMARIGLEHLNAGWCDAGWNDSVLTLELKNMTHNHFILLEEGCSIGQIVFFKHEKVPLHASYRSRGRYNGDSKVMEIKQ